MQVRVTQSLDVSADDMAKALMTAGADAFGAFMLAVYSEMKDRNFDLDGVAQVMARRMGSGRLEVFDKLTRLIAYHQECERRPTVELMIAPSPPPTIDSN